MPVNPSKKTASSESAYVFGLSRVPYTME